MPIQSPAVEPRQQDLSPAQPVPVLHLLHTVAYGGVETVILNWLSRLDRSRFTPHLVCFSNPSGTERPFLEAATRAGLTVELIPWSRRKPVLRSARRLAAILARHRIQILHTHNTYADLVGLVAARLHSVRTLTTLYVWSNFNWKRNLLQRFNRSLLRFFDLVSAHCEITYSQTLAFGVSPDRLRLLICGFEAPRVNLLAAERTRLRQLHGATESNLILINVARLHPEKEQAWLLDIFAQLSAAHPHAVLWIAGVGPLESFLRSRCAALNLEDRVRFLGFQTNLPELLALADVHVNTSSAEGVPLAICSAMAAELPIVASSVGGLPEILNHGNAGVLVPFGATDDFVLALDHLLTSPTERQRLGAAARRFIEVDYSLGTAVQRLESTYQELLSPCA